MQGARAACHVWEAPEAGPGTDEQAAAIVQPVRPGQDELYALLLQYDLQEL